MISHPNPAFLDFTLDYSLQQSLPLLGYLIELYLVINPLVHKLMG
jgi:hypothetical protein